MSRTLPCPDSAANHDEHAENSREYNDCREHERRRTAELLGIGAERAAGSKLTEVPPTSGFMQKALAELAALGNPARSKGQSSGPSFS